MKKNILIGLLSMCIIALVVYIAYDNINNHNIEIEDENAQNIISNIDNYNNTVIDKYYLPKLNVASATYEINDIADKYMNAWKSEFQNVVNDIKSKLVFEQDKLIFDNYYKEYENLALLGAEAEYLKYIDISKPVTQRLAGTGSSYASILVMKNIYKQGAINLIKYFNTWGEDKNYEYIFRGEQ